MKSEADTFFSLFIACVASVSSRVRRVSWDESKKKGMTGEGEGNEGTHFFFCSRSNFRAINRLETLATQATLFTAFVLLAKRYLLF